MNLIAETIQRERLTKGLTEKDLARKCGLAENYIKQVEAGKKIIQQQAAERILKILGVEPDVLNQGTGISRPADTWTEEAPLKPKSTPAQRISIEPNDQWTDALAHIIRRFPVEDLSTGKVVGYKELPVLGKKVEGCPWERIRFFQVSDSQLQIYRIHRKDVLMTCEQQEIKNGKLHVLEVKGQRMIRKLSIDQQKWVTLTAGTPGSDPVTLKVSQIKVIGECIKVEFLLSNESLPNK